MNPDTTRQLKSAATISGIGVAALTAVLVLAPDPAPQRPTPTPTGRKFEFSWQNCPGAKISVVEGSTNGKTWWVIAWHTNENFYQRSTLVFTGLQHEMIRVGHPTNVPGYYWRRL